MSAFVLGIDPSLTNTGYALVAGGKVREMKSLPTTGRRAASLFDRRGRINGIAGRVVADAALWMPDLVVIENPAYSKNVGSTHDRSGLWWLMVEGLLGLGYPVVAVAPTARAKYATGSGRAGKAEVVAAVESQWGDLLPRPCANDDEADAVVLAAMGVHGLGLPLHPERLSDGSYEAVRGVEWPAIP